MPWHHQSEYAQAGHFQPMNRDERGIWTCRAQIAHRNGRLTAKALLVGLTLLRHHGRDGRCDPSHQRLARLAGCCERTVRNALDMLKACGLLDWTRRIRRDPKIGARQTSSAFRLLIAKLERLAHVPRPQRAPRRNATREATAATVAQRSAEGAAAMLDELRPTISAAERLKQRYAALYATSLNRRNAG